MGQLGRPTPSGENLGRRPQILSLHAKDIPGNGDIAVAGAALSTERQRLVDVYPALASAARWARPGFGIAANRGENLGVPFS
jgi:hypothetical protein